MMFKILLIFIPLIAAGDDGSTILSFDKPYYTATYTVTTEGVVSITTEDVIINDSEAEVTVTGDEALNFAIACSTGLCTLAIKRDLPESILANEYEIILELQAVKEGIVEPAFALLIINLPLKDLKPAPKFTQAYYIYDYEIDDDGTPSLIDLGVLIAVADDKNTSVEVILSDFQDYFSVKNNANLWEINIDQPLEDNILKENRELIITLTAILEGAADNGTATLLIKLPEKNASNVTFDRLFYEATYTAIKNELDLISVEENIIISNEEAEVSLSGDYAYHFVIECLGGNCKLTVKEDLPEDILTSNKELIIGLEASTGKNLEPSIAFIIIHLPLENVKSAPKFDQIYYIYEYNVDEEELYLTPNGDPISITSDNNTFVEVTLSNYEDNFAVTYDFETDQWYIEIIEVLSATVLKENTELVLGLTGKLEDSEEGTATLIIKLLEENSTAVTFDKSFYRATYVITDNFDKIITEEEITINDSEATVVLTGDYAFHFSVNCSTGKCQLTVEDNLSEKTLSEEKEILLEFEVTKKNIVEPITTYLLITLPAGEVKSGPKFSQTYYIYEYQVDSENASLILNGDPITIRSDNNTLVQVTLDDYEDNFAVTYDSDADQWNIDIKKPLNEATLKENTELILSLMGELGYSEKGAAALLIKLPEKSLTGITFAKSFYKARYIVTEEELDRIVTEEDIIISDREATVALTGDYAYHFGIDCSTGTCQLTVEDDLSEKILSSEKEIIIGLEITKEDIVEPVTTYLFITLPSGNINSGVKFSQIYYVYEYQVYGEEPSLTADGDSIAIASDNNTSIQLTFSDYEDNFAFTYDSDSDQWKIDIRKPLSETVLKENTELVLGLTGKLDNSEEGTATLLIKLPEKNSTAVIFGKSIYKATYVVTDEEFDELITEEEITISDSEATVALAGDYALYFSIDCSTGTCQLDVAIDLSEKILSSEKEIILGLEVTKEDIIEPVTTYLLITLPSEDIKSGPKFSQTYYVYDYQVHDKEPSLIADGNSITVTSDNNTSVQITLSDYKDNFAVTYDSESDQWKIDVKEPLSETILKENTELLLSLTGVLGDSEKGTATLLIKLPTAVTFGKSFYNVTYVVTEDGLDKIITEEEITISDSEATVVLVGDYAAHFNIDCSTGTCQLTVEGNLSEKTLSDNKEIILRFEVTKDDIVEPVTTYLLITLM